MNSTLSFDFLPRICSMGIFEINLRYTSGGGGVNGTRCTDKRCGYPGTGENMPLL